jgi:hypothetical protein
VASLANAQTATSAEATSSSLIDAHNTNIYALTTDNFVYVLLPDGGNLIGIDFRPADAKLYGLTDLGGIFTIDVSTFSVGNAALVSTLNPRFIGGFGNVMDFNRWSTPWV